jgi:hypothetical protein
MKRFISIAFYLHTMTLPVAEGTIPTSNASLFDIFPLTPKLYYAYDYYSESYFFEVTMLVQMSVDSGLVEYFVRDSIMSNDSTIVWNVEERHTLWRRRYNTSLRQDTSYWTHDTVFLSRYENTSGCHQLTSSALIWQFPLSAPDQPVYRYSDSQSFTLARKWNPLGPPGSGVDTLWFSARRGFLRRSRSYTGVAITYFFTRLNLALREGPVVTVREQLQPPTTLELWQNYPNPFNPTTTIQYTLPQHGFVSLRLYDLLGREILLLDEGIKSAGYHSVTVNANHLSSGVYFYRLSSSDLVLTRKLMLTK